MQVSSSRPCLGGGPACSVDQQAMLDCRQAAGRTVSRQQRSAGLRLGNAGAARSGSSSQHMSSQRPPPRVRPVCWLQQQRAVALLLQACLLAGALTAVSAQNTAPQPAASSSSALSTAEATADRESAETAPSACLAVVVDPRCCAGRRTQALLFEHALALKPVTSEFQQLPIGLKREDHWRSGDILLEAVGEWDNWQLFKTANNISGWNASGGTTACGWDRVTCDTAGRVTEM